MVPEQMSGTPTNQPSNPMDLSSLLVQFGLAPGTTFNQSGPYLLPVRSPETGKIVYVKNVDTGEFYPYTDPNAGRLPQSNSVSTSTSASDPQSVAKGSEYGVPPPGHVTDEQLAALRQTMSAGDDLSVWKPSRLRQQMSEWLPVREDIKKAGMRRDPLTRDFESELGSRVRRKMRNVIAKTYGGNPEPGDE